MLLMTNWWRFLFPVKFLRPKFAEADFCANLRNPELVDFFLLHLCCLLDDLKGQCRQKNSAVVCWFLPYFNEKGNCNAAKQDGNFAAR